MSGTSTSTAHSAYKPLSSARVPWGWQFPRQPGLDQFFRGCEDLMTHADDLPDPADLDEHRADYHVPAQ